MLWLLRSTECIWDTVLVYRRKVFLRCAFVSMFPSGDIVRLEIGTLKYHRVDFGH